MDAADSKPTEFFIENKENAIAMLETLKWPTDRPTLSQAMHMDGVGQSYGQLMWSYHDAQQKLAKAQSQIKQIISENIYIRDKLYNVRRYYDHVQGGLKAMNPKAAAPYYKYAHDSRNLSHL